MEELIMQSNKNIYIFLKLLRYITFIEIRKNL